MSDTWDDYAEGWDSNSDVVVYSNKAFQQLTKVVNLEGLEVFDFGCGTGLLTEKISPLVQRVTALDSSKKMIEVLAAKNLRNVTTLYGLLPELMNLPNSELHSGFDLVTASSVCAFVPDYEATAMQLKSLLKPKGVLVQWDWYSKGGGSSPGFTEEQIQEVLEKVGFCSVHVSTAFTMAGPEGESQVLMAVAKM